LLLPAACSLRGVRRMVPGPYRGKCCFFGVGAGNDFIYSSVAAVTGSSVEADPFIHHLGPSLPDLFPYSRATLLSISFFLALLNKWISLAVRSFRINIYYGLLPWFRSLIQRKSLMSKRVKLLLLFLVRPQSPVYLIEIAREGLISIYRVE
jgi:hypothetical protein